MINLAFTVYRALVCAPRRVVTAVAVLIFASSMAMAQPTGVGEGWQVRADDQGLRIGESGFLIPNVTVEDRNGDLVGDRPYILRATGIWNGVRYYARAEVTIRSGMLSEVTNASFTFTTEPPDLPTVLQFQECDATLQVGQATLCGVQALRNDGTIDDVTTALGTAFSSSDPSILSVDDASIVTGVRAGAGFITATNDGVSTSKTFFVRTPTVETMVEGFLLLPDGEPAAGISVTTAGGGAVSDAAGRFTIPLVLPAGQLISLAALGQVGGQSYAGAKAGVEAMPDGITDAGLITLAPQDQPVWTARLPLFNRLDDNGAYAVAFDSDRGVLVLSGAARSRGELHTWERDAAGGWRLRAVEPHYGPLHGMQTVYDSGRQRVVRVSLELDDVTLTPVVRAHEWNGVAWALRSTDGPTPAWDISSTDVSSFGLAYDAGRAVTYYVGDNEFWEWDGDAWTAQPASRPAGRKAIVRDSARDRLIAFAVDAFTERLSIWEFDGAAWQSRPIPYNIIVFLISTMSAVYDPAQNVTWLSVANGFGGQQERYRWDGATLQLAAQGYVSGTDPALYFDSVAQQAMSYSGFRLTSHGQRVADTGRTAHGERDAGGAPGADDF